VRRVFPTMGMLTMLAACSNEGTAPPPGPPPTPPTIVIEGTGVREGPVGQALPPLTIRVSNAPPVGETVTIEVTGGGSVSPSSVRISAAVPSVVVTWTLGPQAGEQQLRASMPGAATVAVPATARAVTLVVPTLDRSVFATGFSNPWDLAWLPDSSLLITERSGIIFRRSAQGALTTIARPTDVVASGEGGMLGLTVDPDFATNRFVYACFSSRASGANDNRVVRWRLSVDNSALGERTDIVTGLPWANGGRHSGCRPRFGPDGALWVGTGDAAVGSTPQDLRSLGGKVLRVTRDGVAAPGNPTIANADPRIYSYGHRNVQGVTFQPGTNATFTAEHGPGRDDEINQLRPGMNAGWDPIPGYNESVSMTDQTKYPSSVAAVWATGQPARGTSGAVFLRGSRWGAWNGALAIGQLSGLRLAILPIDASGRAGTPVYLFESLVTRVRTPVMGPDSALYVTTDVGGGNAQIWRIAPR
jgi:aldose sugar dehydrogenase